MVDLPCPYCGALMTPPSSMKKCSACGELVLFRTDPETRAKVLVTEAGAKLFDDLMECYGPRNLEPKAVREAIKRYRSSCLRTKNEGAPAIAAFDVYIQNKLISIWETWLDDKRKKREDELQAQYGMTTQEAVAWTAFEHGEPKGETAARLGISEGDVIFTRGEANKKIR